MSARTSDAPESAARAGRFGRGAGWHRTVCLVLVVLTFAAQALLAYRWASPVGSLSLGRVLLLVSFVAVSPRLLRLRVGRDGARLLAASGLLLASLLVGLLHSEHVRTGVTQLVNSAEALLLFGLVFVMAAWLAETSPRLPAAMLYLSFVPSGLIGLFQGIRLGLGETPFIPFLWLFNLDDQTANAARVSFGSGLNEFGLDRVASATGDPPTFGIQCAVLIVIHVWLRRHGARFAPRLVVLPVVLLAVVDLILSASTTAILVAVVGSGIALATRPAQQVPSTRQHWKWQLPAAVAIVVAAVAVPITRDFLLSAVQRASGVFSNDGSGGEHLSLIIGGLRLLAHHPLLGVGVGDGSAIFFGGEVGFSSFHSVLTITAAEQGLLGVAALAVLFGLLALRFLPPAVSVAGLLSFAMYLDLNRLPWLWGAFAVAAFVHRAVVLGRRP